MRHGQRLDGAGYLLSTGNQALVQFFHRAIGATALRAMGAGYGQLQGGKETVDVGNLAAGDHGESVVEIEGGAGYLIGELGRHVDGVGRLGNVNESAVKVGENGQERHFYAAFEKRLGHGGSVRWTKGCRGNARGEQKVRVTCPPCTRREYERNINHAFVTHSAWERYWISCVAQKDPDGGVGVIS